jgi:hypothetical protein
VLLLHTKKEEGEEYMLYAYPENNARFQQFVKLKGVLLAWSGVTGSLLGEQAKIFTFQIKQEKQQM